MSTRFTALTVKEGDAFLLEDDGWKCLFDSGGIVGTIVDLLKYKGIDKLDLAICSHNDADHANGFIELLESGFQIDEIWLPSLWASILLFVKENRISDDEVEFEKEYFNGKFESLFSKESVSCESFNQDLSFWEEMKDFDNSSQLYERIHEKLAHELTENPDILAHFLTSNLKQHFNGGFKKDWLEDYLHDQLWDYCCRYKTYRETCSLAKRITRLPHLHSAYKNYLNVIRQDRPFDERKISINNLNVLLYEIMLIFEFARYRGCTIRWFEPTSTCSKNVISHGFMALNASEIFRIKKLKNYMAYYYALTLTRENKYSLVFEYSKNSVPIIRFSADSNSTCQSESPYKKNIIVTAPHHGSCANSVVYRRIKGNDIIWVRSDERSYERPCPEFKNQPSKYCLACNKYNFLSEICFEYSPWDQKWHHIHGEQCRCKE